MASFLLNYYYFLNVYQRTNLSSWTFLAFSFFLFFFFYLTLLFPLLCPSSENKHPPKLTQHLSRRAKLRTYTHVYTHTRSRYMSIKERKKKKRWSTMLKTFTWSCWRMEEMKLSQISPHGNDLFWNILYNLICNTAVERYWHQQMCPVPLLTVSSSFSYSTDFLSAD